MSRKTVSMIGNLTRDMMSDVMETSLKKPIYSGVEMSGGIYL